MKKSIILVYIFISLSFLAESNDLVFLETHQTHNLYDSEKDSSIIIEKSKLEISSSINNKKSIIQQDNFVFMVSGHFHGSSNGRSGMPASTLMANMDTLNGMNLDFMVCLGDLFLNVEKDHSNFEKYFFSKLKSPLFNAVGNHDVDNEFYKNNYGPTFQSFVIGKSKFIIIDTELDNGNISEQQLDFFKRAIQSNEGIKNIFIFMHRTLWAENDDELSKLFPDNTKSKVGNNFESTIFPMIKNVSKKSKIYLFSGSIGGMAPASFFYHPFSDKIVFIATAIRDLPRDAVLIVDIKNDVVSFKPFSLTSNKVIPLEEYTMEWWISHKAPQPSFNWRLVPLYLWQMITHRYFWYGLGYTIFFTIMIYFFYKIKQRGKKA